MFCNKWLILLALSGWQSSNSVNSDHFNRIGISFAERCFCCPGQREVAFPEFGAKYTTGRFADNHLKKKTSNGRFTLLLLVSFNALLTAGFFSGLFIGPAFYSRLSIRYYLRYFMESVLFTSSPFSLSALFSQRSQRSVMFFNSLAFATVPSNISVVLAVLI